MSTTLREVDEEALKFLRANRGEFYTAALLEPILDYSEGYIRERLHELADDPGNDVERDRRSKEIYGVMVGNTFYAITDDREALLEIVKEEQPWDLAEAKAMSTSELRSFIIDEVADTEVTSDTDVLYFGIPE